MGLIVVDTSALLAILLGEDEASSCSAVLETTEEALISAATLAEALVVSGRKGLRDEMKALVHRLEMTVVPATATTARQVANAYDRWGKGVHPAKLNLGDCFAYVLAEERGCPLLFVGNDFAQTDIPSARAAGSP